MAEKRIRNKSTGKYYKIRERNSRYGRKGEIMGLWHGEKGKRPPPRDDKGRFKKKEKRTTERKGFFRWLFGK